MFLEQPIKVKHVFIVTGLVILYKLWAAYELVYQISNFLNQMVQR